MRLFFILDNTYPEGMAASARVRAYSKGVQAHGVEMFVLIPQARKKLGQSGGDIQKSGVDRYGSKYKYFGGLVRSRYLIVRKIQDITGILRTLRFVLRNTHTGDVVILYEGKDIWKMLFARAAHLKGCIVGEEINELPYVYEGIARAEQKRDNYFKHVLSRLDFAITISSALSEILHKKKPGINIIEIPILLEEANPEKRPTPAPYPYIFHSGTLSQKKDGILDLLKAFAIASKKINGELHLICTGRPDNSLKHKEILKVIAENGIEEKVEFIGYVSQDTLQRYQSNSSIEVLCKPDTSQNKYCFSTKLGEYLSHSCPVVMTKVGETERYFTNKENAYIVEPGDVIDIAQAIVTLYSDVEEASRIGKNGHKMAVDKFDPCHHMGRLIDFLSNGCNRDGQ